ncbi:MAG: hypothetical protein ISR47_06270 [Rhodospirillales bacterium]|nr:hypothetical protein [Rhodospirillales bacterium]
MTNLNFESVHALVANPSPQTCAEIEAMLKEIGVADVHVANSLESVRGALLEKFVDLFIADTDWPDGDLGETISAIRHGELGTNPFLAVLGVAKDDESMLSWRARRHGAESILPVPFDSATLGDAMRGICLSRKPFVVTSDYVGPDRRAGSGRESQIPMLDVPNSLRDRAMGTFNDENTARAIVDMKARVNAEKLDRHGSLIVLLANRVGPDLMVAGVDEGIRIFFEQIIWTAEDVVRRLGGTADGRSVEVCKSLIGQIAKLDQLRGVPSTADVNRMITLAKAVKTEVAPNAPAYAARP